MTSLGPNKDILRCWKNIFTTRYCFMATGSSKVKWRNLLEGSKKWKIDRRIAAD